MAICERPRISCTIFGVDALFERQRLGRVAPVMEADPRQARALQSSSSERRRTPLLRSGADLCTFACQAPWIQVEQPHQNPLDWPPGTKGKGLLGRINWCPLLAYATATMLCGELKCRSIRLYSTIAFGSLQEDSHRPAPCQYCSSAKYPKQRLQQSISTQAQTYAA